MQREQIAYKEYLHDGRWHYWGYIAQLWTVGHSNLGFIEPIQYHSGKPTVSYQVTDLLDSKGTRIYIGDKLSAKYVCPVGYDNKPHRCTGFVQRELLSGEWVLDMGHSTMPLTAFSDFKVIGHEATDE